MVVVLARFWVVARFHVVPVTKVPTCRQFTPFHLYLCIVVPLTFVPLYLWILFVFNTFGDLSKSHLCILCKKTASIPKYWAVCQRKIQMASQEKIIQRKNWLQTSTPPCLAGYGEKWTNLPNNCTSIINPAISNSTIEFKCKGYLYVRYFPTFWPWIEIRKMGRWWEFESWNWCRGLIRGTWVSDRWIFYEEGNFW